MANKIGADCKAYYGTVALAGTPDTGAWNLINNMRDLRLPVSVGEAEMNTRGGNSGWEAIVPTLLKGEITFEMLWDTADAAFTKLQTAFLAKAELAFAAMDGPIATKGSQGLAGNFYVTNFERNEPLQEGVKVSVTLKCSSRTAWYTVA